MAGAAQVPSSAGDRPDLSVGTAIETTVTTIINERTAAPGGHHG